MTSFLSKGKLFFKKKSFFLYEWWQYELKEMYRQWLCIYIDISIINGFEYTLEWRRKINLGWKILSIPVLFFFEIWAFCLFLSLSCFMLYIFIFVGLFWSLIFIETFWFEELDDMQFVDWLKFIIFLRARSV